MSENKLPPKERVKIPRQPMPEQPAMTCKAKPPLASPCFSSRMSSSHLAWQ